MTAPRQIGERLRRMAILAALYAVFGWLGLQLAVPPGYATIIWPASGIAIAALLFYGPGLWPGVFLGSFAVNAAIGGAIGAGGLDLSAVLVAAIIAGGSTAQSVAARILIHRNFGVPVELRNVRGLLFLLLLAGPVPCLVAASVGVTTLYAAGIAPRADLLNNWLTWWTGDVAGILVMLPIALMVPWRPWSLRWSGRPVTGFTVASLVALMIPLGLTFYAWKLTSETTYEKNLAAFSVLAEDSQQALLHRVTSYKLGLDGGAGLFRSSDAVSVSEWRSFVDELRIDRNLPGINGIGYIEPVELGRIDRFLEEVAKDGIADLSIHPDADGADLFVIKYIEPIARNVQAVGLNIAFEQNRREAAAHARDTGRPTITKRIFLVQDTTRSAGFLLLRPLYDDAAALKTQEQRRAAFRGWIYAPFVANRFMAGLTASQGVEVEISVYDGAGQDADQLIYASRAAEPAARVPVFRVSRVLSVMEQEWTVSWESTPAFEASVASQEPGLVLAGGVSLTLLFGVLLFTYARREEAIRHTVDLKTREIAAREGQNRSIVDTAVAGFVILDASETILSVNRASEMIFGYSAEELVGQPATTILDRSAGEDLAGRHAAGDAASPASAKLVASRTKSGEDLCLNVQRNFWHTESGALRHTLIISDVTEQQRAANALEESERRWKHALEGANMGVFDIDLTTGRSFVSDTWKAMLGFAPADRIEPQQEWLLRVHPDDLPTVRALDLACIEGRAERSRAEYRIRCKDGTWIWLRSDAIVIERDADGVATRMIGTQTDITDLRGAEAALRSSEERFRSAIESAPVGMALIDSDGEWLQVNEALCSLLGYTQDELLDLDLARITHSEDRDAIGRPGDELVEASVSTRQTERRFVHKRGHALWCLFSVSVVRDHDTGSCYFVTQFQDINDRKEMERLKSEFVATVSHELRTPLTSIRGSLGLVMGTASANLDPGARHLLTIASKNCERLIELINDILDLEKITSGAMKFERRTENLNELVEQAIEANDAYFEKFEVRPVLHADGECLVDVDRGRLQQVLSNLLSNAAKFSPPGGAIEVGIAVSGETARVTVADQGGGVPVEFEDRIFGRFSQADSSATRQKGGTGLGLHISRQIIEQMGGTIGYRNVPGAGAEFAITLPCSAALPGEPACDEGPCPGIECEERALPRALHVEDDDDFIDILTALLKGRVELVSAHTLAYARAMLAAQPFDLLILDLELPDGSGLDLLDDLRRSGRDLPTVVVSAAETDLGGTGISETIVKSRATEQQLVSAIVRASRSVAPAAERGREDAVSDLATG